MHYILFLRLEGFYCQTLERGDSTLLQKPLVVHRDKIVLDSNATAQQLSVTRGMPLSEAKAILQNGVFIPWEEEPYRLAQREWLEHVTEVSDVIEPDEQHSAWVDLSAHPNPESVALNIRALLAKRLSIPVAIGLAPAKWIAKLACSHGSGDCSLADAITIREPLSNPDAFLSPIKTRFLLPIEAQHRSRLEFLGYRTIGEVAQVPLEILYGQFGDVATHIRMCARGGFSQPVEALYPPNCILERISFDGGLEDLQALDAALQDIAVRLSSKLSKTDTQSKDVILSLELEPHRDEASVIKRRRKFTKPIQNYASALSSLRLLLHPTPERAVLTLRVRLENVTHTKRIQQELSGRTDAGERQKGVVAAFQHVRTVFGDSSIVTGNEVVEPRRKQVLRAWRDATGWT